MKVYTSLKDIHNIEATACALGNFDGIHKGHQQLITKAVSLAGEKDLKSAVFTFTNHPVNTITGKNVVKNILTFDEKVAIFENTGIDYLFSVEFTDVIRTSPADCFCRYILSELLNVREAVCGFNYRFAYKAEGTPEILAELGKELGYGVSVIPAYKIGGDVVSSTLIREKIASGRIDEYEAYTGRPYCMAGRVVEGCHMGKRLGFPTVNLSLSDEMALPLSGVYLTYTYVNQVKYPSITNVGNKPSVGIFEKNAETHILGFDEDIYGADIKVEFIRLMRPERKFESLDELTAQIAEDCVKAKEFHGL